MRPLCFEDDEWEAWVRLSDAVGTKSDTRTDPCSVCLIGHALEMRAVGKCNGRPGGADDEDDEIAPPTEGELRRREALRQAAIRYRERARREQGLPEPDEARRERNRRNAEKYRERRRVA